MVQGIASLFCDGTKMMAEYEQQSYDDYSRRCSKIIHYFAKFRWLKSLNLNERFSVCRTFYLKMIFPNINDFCTKIAS